MLLRRLAFTLLLSIPGFATDCQTDCESHFDGPWQVYDLNRCQAEREIACKTGLTNCDTFKAPIWDAGYAFAIKVVENRSKENRWPSNPTQCHETVATVFLKGGKISTAYGAYEFATVVYESSMKAAIAAKAATLWVPAAVEGAKAMCHCACKHARYTNFNGPQSEGNPADLFAVSMTGSGGWSELWGKNTTESRNELFTKVSKAAGPRIHQQINSTFGSHQRNLGEVICSEGTFWATDFGGAAMTKCFNTVKERGWKNCIFRVSGLPAGDPEVSDWYFASVRRGQRWWVRTGPIELKDQVVAEAVHKVGGQFDEKKEGRFSTHRMTRTRAACSKPANVSDGLSVEDSMVLLSGGQGRDSFLRSSHILKEKHPGYGGCIFDISDFEFGPVVPKNYPLPTYKTIQVTFKNSTGSTVNFRLNGGGGLNVGLGGGLTSSYTMTVDKGILPVIQITQPNGQKLSFTVLDGGSYQIINRDGRLENAYN